MSVYQPFPASLLTEHLPDYRVVVFQLSPREVGFPSNRSRQFAVMFLKGKTTWHGSVRDFWTRFGKEARRTPMGNLGTRETRGEKLLRKATRCCCSCMSLFWKVVLGLSNANWVGNAHKIRPHEASLFGDSLMLSSLCQQHDSMMTMTSMQRKYPDKESRRTALQELAPRDLLPVSQRMRLEQYEKLGQERLLVDLEQNPGYGVKPSLLVPTAISHGSAWSCPSLSSL